jgi:hypothetical protein
MRIFKSKIDNDLTFEFTERIYENKIKSFKKFAKIYMKSYYKRKYKVKGCYITYTFGYKTKEPFLYYKRSFFPVVSFKPTIGNIIMFSIDDMENEYDFRTEKSDDIIEQKNYYLRAITITFVYDKPLDPYENAKQTKRKKHKNK